MRKGREEEMKEEGDEDIGRKRKGREERKGTEEGKEEQKEEYSIRHNKI